MEKASGRHRLVVEIPVRAGGLGLLALAGWLAAWLHRLVLAQGEQPPEFLLGLAAVILIASGLALACKGPGLFGRMPRPPRALLP